jgi:hypothetical protein
MEDTQKYNLLGNLTTYGTIELLLKHVPSVLNSFSMHVRSHMEFLEKVKGFSGVGHQLNSVNGYMFELIVLDALIKYGVDPNIIRRNYKILAGADIDIKIKNYGLHLKKSCRERYKEDDRTAAIASNMWLSINMLGLTYKEWITKSDKENIEYVNTINRSCHFGLKWYSILDEEATNKVINKVITDTKSIPYFECV